VAWYSHGVVPDAASETSPRQNFGVRLSDQSPNSGHLIQSEEMRVGKQWPTMSQRGSHVSRLDGNGHPPLTPSTTC
jgi:hypothetical protein